MVQPIIDLPPTDKCYPSTNGTVTATSLNGFFDTHEKRREIHFIGKQEKLILHDITSINLQGNWWRINCREGFVVIDPSKVAFFISEK